MNEILNLSKKEELGHVPGVENPADIGSRGSSPLDLKENALWWKGPLWLRDGEEAWPRIS